MCNLSTIYQSGNNTCQVRESNAKPFDLVPENLRVVSEIRIQIFFPYPTHPVPTFGVPTPASSVPEREGGIMVVSILNFSLVSLPAKYRESKGRSEESWKMLVYPPFHCLKYPLKMDIMVQDGTSTPVDLNPFAAHSVISMGKVHVADTALRRERV
ncbi:hypothetical protein TNCV_877761 [Trichonephila clavipes]|nr:hypothetical protein TNCV_877761 [Trichonephila clavipes]